MTLDRWELLRMLGAAAGDPGSARAAGAVLGLPPCGDTEHAEVFAVNCPPYASVYLGTASTGRLAAFWAAAGLGMPPEPDHLTTLLGLYASLGAAMPEPGQLRPAQLRPAHLRPAQLRPAQLRPAQSRPAQPRPAQLRHTLFREYLWPWLPAFLGAVSDLPAGALTPWAELTLCTLRRERERERERSGSWTGAGTSRCRSRCGRRRQPTPTAGPASFSTGSSPPCAAASSSPGGPWRQARTELGLGSGSGTGGKPWASCWPPSRSARPTGWRTRRIAGRGGTWPWSRELPAIRSSSGGPTVPRAPPACCALVTRPSPGSPWLADVPERGVWVGRLGGAFRVGRLGWGGWARGRGLGRCASAGPGSRNSRPARTARPGAARRALRPRCRTPGRPGRRPGRSAPAPPSRRPAPACR